MDSIKRQRGAITMDEKEFLKRLEEVVSEDGKPIEAKRAQAVLTMVRDMLNDHQKAFDEMMSVDRGVTAMATKTMSLVRDTIVITYTAINQWSTGMQKLLIEHGMLSDPAEKKKHGR
jgi:metal-responsive CopG/Arc/MetJ family transcriptional regulator